MSEPVFDKHLVAIARCQESLADFANFERWQILSYLMQRYGMWAQLMPVEDALKTAQGEPK